MESQKYLYKYRRWDDDEKHQHQKTVITEKKIYFTSADKFNDPFDCNIPLRYDLLLEEDQLSVIKRYILEIQPNINPTELNTLAEKGHEKGYLNSQENIERALKKLRNVIGIFTATKTYKNILMWSHYANSHSGYCVGFNLPKLLLFFKKLKNDRRITITEPVKVVYKNKYPIYLPNVSDDDDSYIKPFVTKSKLWKYEDEYRIFRSGLANFSLQLDEGIISKVILGSMMESKHREEIKLELCKWPNRIELFEAKMRKDQFGLDFERIPY